MGLNRNLELMAKIKICKEESCQNSQTTGGFCRLHYLKNWKKIQLDKKKKAAKNLNRYVESILKRNPDRYVEIIKKDIRSKKFEQFVEDEFGSLEPGGLFDSPTYEQEIDELLDQIKVEGEV